MCSSSPPAVTAAGPSVALPPGQQQTTTWNNATLGGYDSQAAFEWGLTLEGNEHTQPISRQTSWDRLHDSPCCFWGEFICFRNKIFQGQWLKCYSKSKDYHFIRDKQYQKNKQKKIDNMHAFLLYFSVLYCISSQQSHLAYLQAAAALSEPVCKNLISWPVAPLTFKASNINDRTWRISPGHKTNVLIFKKKIKCDTQILSTWFWRWRKNGTACFWKMAILWLIMYCQQ